jgi:hypothetical protein
MSILVNTRPIFQRAMRVISSITNANPAVVTTTTNHQYITGMIVRLNIPKGFGLEQANQKYGQITVLTDTTYSIDIDTTLMDPFLSWINLGTTNGSGAISGTISTNQVPFDIGQAFFIGDEFYLIITDNGALYCDGDGAGTFNVSTGVYSITGAPASTTAYFSSVKYPMNLQFSQCTPIGEINSTLQAATQNVLGTNFYN